MQEQKFKGMPYPIEKHPRGYLRTQWGVNQIKSDLLILLLTNPGERVMLPNFGTPLRRLFFEPNDQIIIEQAREMIINSIRMWEPRITVTNIEVWSGSNDYTEEEDDSKDHILNIRIIFIDPENIQSVQELELRIPLGGV